MHLLMSEHGKIKNAYQSEFPLRQDKTMHSNIVHYNLTLDNERKA